MRGFNPRPKKRTQKFNAKTTHYAGLRFKSKLEASFAMELDWRKKAKEVKSWKYEHVWSLRVNGEQICKYAIDFRVVNSDGSIDYVEIKGAKTYAFQLKWNLTQALFDELTEGENAHLYLNDTLVMSSYKN